MVRTIAITGGIGSGKSKVGDSFRSLGYPVVDADALAHLALNLPAVIQDLLEYFGADILDVGTSKIDRKRLGQIVFTNSEHKKFLEKIIHPQVHALFAEACVNLEAICKTAWLFYEIPLLFELGRQKDFDAVILVTANKDIKITRLQQNRGLTILEIEKIIAAQMPDSAKINEAHIIIDNNSDLQKLDVACLNAVSILKAKFSLSNS